ncbi:MAG TPA: adenylyltransferase/cytidyltransferase family protein, partial [Salinivirgaceae bacterium]|nr:adenylyltransferase/cytidyltransferase family protein [Salinivirgaceae bacterium]
MNNLDLIISKLHTVESIQRVLAYWRFKNHKVVFSNGCFDILHRGHIEYLAQAADFGDHLVIGLNTDASVRRLKGPERPLQDEVARSL